MVVTFEFTSNGAALYGEDADMRAASARLPEGAYTTFRTYGGNRVLRLNQHARRLRESIALMGQPAVRSDALVRDGVAYALRQTGYPESRFRLTLAQPAAGQAWLRFYVSIEPFTPYPARMYETGVFCVTVTLRRDNPHAKSTAFIASAGEAYRALPPGVHEGLMVADDGSLLEGLSSNFFAWVDDVLHTEQARALVGVTQSTVLELAHARFPDLPIVTTAPRLADVTRIAECFITSVSREILPVVRIDDAILGNGQPGPSTRALIAAFRALIEREAEAV